MPGADQPLLELRPEGNSTSEVAGECINDPVITVPAAFEIRQDCIIEDSGQIRMTIERTAAHQCLLKRR
jgi:hypothetical protein